jgi:hypothetical protein
MRKIYYSLKGLAFISLLLILVNSSFGQIAQRGVATTNTTNGTTLNINKPTGLQIGDLMIASILQSGVDNNSLSDASSTGWLEIAGSSLNNGNNRYRGTLLYKVATVGDLTPPSYAFTLDGNSNDGEGAIVAFSGVAVSAGVDENGNPGGPFDIDPGNSFNNINNDNTLNANAISNITANAAIVMFGDITDNQNLDTWTTTNPGALNEIYDIPFNAGLDMGLGAAWSLKSTTGSTGGGTAATSNSPINGALLIALRPLASQSTITSFNATSACLGTTPAITITGTNLSGATTVRFNGYTATSFTVVNATTITAVLPSSFLTTGTGNITVTTPLGTAISGGIFTVNTAPAVTAQSTATQTICQNAAPADLSVTATGSGLTYQWYSNTISSSTLGTPTPLPGATNSTYTPLTSSVGTLYYFCVVNGTCSPAATSAVSGAIVITAAPAVFNVTGTGSYCSGGPVGLDGSTVGVSYQLYIGGTAVGAAVSGTGAAISFGLKTGPATYSVKATGATCTSTMNGTAAITIGAAPSITAQPATTIPAVCLNAGATTLSVTASNAVSYQWYVNATASNSGGTLISGATSSSYTPSTLVAGDYYYYCIVTGSCAPTATSNVSGKLTVNSLPTVSAGAGFTKTCTTNASGAAIGETNIAGNTYLWSPITSLSNSAISNPTANPTLTTFYTLTKTNTTTGCKNTASVTVTVDNTPPTVPAITGSTGVCIGATIGLSNATSGGAWSSSNLSRATVDVNSGLVTGVGAGAVNIIYTLTGANGCTGNSQLAVTVAASPTPVIEFTQGANDVTYSISASSCGYIAGGGQNDLDIASGNPGGSATLQWQVYINGNWVNALGPTSTTTQYVLDPQYVNYEVVAGVYQFRILITNNGCTGISNTITLTVTGTPSLVAGAIASNQAFCAASGNPVAFTAAASTGGNVADGYNYQWQSSTDNINFSNIGVTTNTYDAPNLTQTTYFRTVIISGGCIDTTNTVTVSMGLAAIVGTPGAITGSATVCANTPGITYSITPLANATTYNWTIPAGWVITSGAGTPNITVTTGAVGSGNMSVTASNACGTTTAGTSLRTITITAAPTVNAGGVIPAICQGSTTIALGGSFGGAATGAIWSDGGAGGIFANNTGSTPGTATYTASPTSGASVTLTLTSTGGTCGAISTSKILVVTAYPAGSISVSPSSICTGSPVTFSATSGYDLYTFKIDGTIVQGPSINPNFSTSSLIAGNTVTALVFSNNCGFTFTAPPVTIGAQPSATLVNNSVGNSICAGNPITFTGAGGTNYVFKVNGSVMQSGAGNTYTPPLNTLPNNASVTVDVSNASGCTATSAAQIITVKALPAGVLNASSIAICPGENITFTATGGTGSTLYQFTVNNGVTSTIVQAFSAATTYSTTTLTNGSVVTVDVKEGSCSTTYPGKFITVHSLPTGTLTATENSGTANDYIICQGSTVTFTFSNAGYANYNFKINGNSVQNGSSNIYTNLGTLQLGDIVSVDVASSVVNGGCQASFNSVQPITVNPIPVGTISTISTTVCADADVLFTATAGYSNYNFQINGVTAQNGTSNTFSTNTLLTGQTVTVIVTNAGGCQSAFAGITMTVTALPSGTITETDNSGYANNDNIICTGATVTFTAPTGYSNYHFYLNGISSVLNGAGNVYTNATLASGDYITVEITNAAGCKDILTSAPVTVNALPVAGLTATENSGTPNDNIICAGASVTFTATIGFSNYEFFVNGVSVQNGASNTYATSSLTNLAPVSVVITNSNGCSGTIILATAITVNGLPTGSLTVTENSGIAKNDGFICTGASVTFTAPSGYTGYHFRVGGVSAQNDGTRTFTTTSLTNGAIVTVDVTNSNGCTTSFVPVVITVNSFTVLAPITGVTTLCATFTTTLSNSTPGGSWASTTKTVATIDAGTGVVSALTNTDVPPTTSISYSYTNTAGCVSTVSTVFTVNPLPVPTISGKNPICQNDNEVYLTESGKTNYVWTVVGGTVTAGTGGSTNNNIGVTWTSSGTKTINVNYTNSYGCTAATSSSFTDAPTTPPPTFITWVSPVCLNSTGNVYSTQPGMSDYTWTVSGGTITAGGGLGNSSATITWNSTGSRSVSVNYSDAFGCNAANPTVFPVTVNSLPTATIGGTTNVCVNAAAPKITFTGASGLSPYTFNYTIDAGSGPIAQSPLGTISGTTIQVPVSTFAPGTYIYSLVSVTDGPTTACTQLQSGSATVIVNPLPTVNINTPPAVCSPSTVDLTASAITAGSTGSLSFTYWNNSNGTGAIINPAAVGSGTYYIKGTTISGCSDIKPVTVTVNPKPTAIISGNAAVCLNGVTNVTFTGAGGTAPYTFTYNINGGANSIVTTTVGNSVNVLVTTTTAGTFNYNLVSVQDASSSACTQVQSGTATVLVSPVSVGGTIGVNAVVCSGANSGTLTLSSYVGSIVNWESSTNGGTSWTSIANSTSSLNYTNLTQTTMYRAIVQSGTCSPVYSSNNATITVNPVNVGGSVTSSVSVCSGLNGATLSLLGNSGAVVRWESSIDGGITWPTNISNTTTSLIYSNLTQTTLYRAAIQSGVCPIVYSVPVTITVNPRPTGVISGTAPICTGGTATLTIAVTGSGTISGTLSDGSSFTGTAPTITKLVTPASSTTYTIATLSDAKCTANAGDKTGSAVITVNAFTAIPAISASPAAICLGSSSNLVIASGNTTLISENFEGTSTFTVITTGTNVAASLWTNRTSPYTNGGVTFNDGSKFMLANSRAGGGRTNTALVSPTVSTIGYSALTLSYKTYFRYNNNNDSAIVEVSTNNGVSFTKVQTLLTTTGASNNFALQTISLNAYSNASSFILRFRYTGNNSRYWAVDDVILTGSAPVYNFSWTASPSGTAGLPAGAGIPSNTNANINVTPVATGTTVYTASYTNAAGCTSTSNVNVVVNPLPVVNITAQYCAPAPAGKVRLTAVSTPTATSYIWSTGETTQSIDVNVADVYDVAATIGSGCVATASISVAQELVDNGDFEGGDNGFTSGYVSVIDNPSINTELSTPGYAVDDSARKFNTNFYGHDHSTGTGNFMIINGNTGTTQPTVWQETVSVLPNTTYNFSAWAMGLNNSTTKAILQLNVNGTQLGTNTTLNTGTSAETNNGWQKIAGSWTSGPTTTTAILTITDAQTSGTAGNDFGLDDISFSTLSNFITLISGAGTDAQTLCVNTPITPIVYNVGSGSAPTVSALPAGISSTFNGVNLIISGTPTSNGNFNYTVTTTSCNPISTTGTITVQTQTIALSSGGSAVTTCKGTAVSPIAYTIGGTATGAGITGLPGGLVFTGSGNLFTISGTPTVAGIFNYTITTTGSCTPATINGTITVQEQTITYNAGNTAQVVCINNPITTVSYAIGGTGTGATATGLPTGVIGTFNSGFFSLGGTPTKSGVFNYTITTTGGCPLATSQITGSITVNKADTITLTSVGANLQTVCKGASVTTIRYLVSGGGTGANVTGLPAGLSVSFSAGVLTISGITTAANGVYNYTVTTTGNCAAATANGSITVQQQTIGLTAGAATQTFCLTNGIVPVSFTIGGSASGITTSGLPSGVLVSNVGNIYTLSGTPLVSGVFNYTITTTGTCPPAASVSGTFTVQAQTITLTTGNNTQAYCVGSPIAAIIYNLTGTTGATVSPLPTGVTAVYSAGMLTISGTPTQAGVFAYTVTSTGNCTSATANGTLTSGVNTWTGALSTNWSDPNNWSCGAVPISVTNVVIPTGVSNMPQLTASSQSNTLQLQANTTLRLNGQSFTNFGAISGTGKFIGSATSNLTINAANATSTINFDQTTNGTSNALKDLTISGSGASVDLHDKTALYGTLLPAAGTLKINDTLVLRSDAAGTARVGVVTGAVTYTANSGKVTVERYYPMSRSWRLVTSPLSNTGSIFNNWQAGAPATYVPGKGMFVTGPNPTGSGGNGLDYSGFNNYSMKGWNSATSTYVNIGNTITTNLSNNMGVAANIGYYTFVRGDRNRAPDNTIFGNKNNTTLSSTGYLQTGPQSFNFNGIASATNPTFELIGNPYASSVDFNLLTKNNVYPHRFYIFDPSLGTVGIFVPMEDLGSPGTFTNSLGSTQGNYIQSSQAFFVQVDVTGPATLTFNENNKSTNYNASLFRPVRPAADMQSLRVKLLQANADNSELLMDAVFEQFDDQFTDKVDIDDALKFTNITENLSILRHNQYLSIERRPVIKDNDTIFLQLSKTTQRSYRFAFEPTNLDPGVTAFLEDSYTKQSTPLNVLANSVYNFVINADAKSAVTNRFRIVFKQVGLGPLPVTFKTVKAAQLSGDIAVDWTVENELNIKRYEVEKSADGVSFAKVNTTAASATNSTTKDYRFIDVNPLSGNNFYRIRSIGADGQFDYSNTVLVKMGSLSSGIRIYPNPVTDVIGAEFKHLAAGIYNTRLLNAQGQTVLSKTINHAPGTSMETIQPDYKLLSGIYQLEVTAPDNQVTMVKVIVK